MRAIEQTTKELTRVNIVRLLLAVSLVLPLEVSAQTADAKALYIDKCGRCHGLTGTTARTGPSMGAFIKVVMLPTGPNLTGIVGRPAGRVSGYKYSAELLAAGEAGLVWDRESLDRWLTNSRAMIPGTYMLVKIAQDDRHIIIDYLASQGK